jgi:uncharacterized membrane protein YeiB
MWWKHEPLTETERQLEIARLEGIRDKMLDRAPLSFAMNRGIMSMMFMMFSIAIGNELLFHSERFDWRLLVFAAMFGSLLLSAMGKVWWNPPVEGDHWGMSDRLGYEGDSPRDVQAKIDRLRAQSGKADI